MRAKSGAFGAVLGSWVPTRPRRQVGLARFPSQGRRLRRLNSGAVAGTGALCEPRAAPSAPCAWWGMSSGLRRALRAKSGAFGAVCVVGHEFRAQLALRAKPGAFGAIVPVPVIKKSHIP